METKRGRRYVALALALLTGSILSACGTDEEKEMGELELRIYGESFIEEGIPDTEDEGGFHDGWSVSFDRFLVCVSSVRVASGDDPALGAAGQRIFDLSRASDGTGHLVQVIEAPEGTYDKTDYTIEPARDGVTTKQASPADLQLMKDNGYSIYVEGEAKKGAEVKTIQWGFTTSTEYRSCESSAVVSGEEGASPAQVQLTIHADHLFYDDLFSEEPQVSFDLIAQADGNGDGVVAREELEGWDISGEARYQVGSTEISTLWPFIEHLTGTLGHIDGEGHCELHRR